MLSYPLASSTWNQKELDAIQRVVESDRFTMGPEVRKFEKQFAEKFGSRFAVMSNSGSSANLLAMAAIKYSSRCPEAGKDEVIVPAVSWSTTFYPVSQLGFRLKFVDINLNTLNMDMESVTAAINERTAGIFAVNLLGNPSELKELRDLADEKSIFLLEDNCESMGAKISDAFTGTFGDIGTFSTFFSHHISTMEGGVCLTDDEELAQIMTSLRAHGWTRELPDENLVWSKSGSSFDDLYRFVLPGYNLRPLEMSGAIGQEQLLKLDSLVMERRENAALFKSSMSEFKEIQLQKEHGESSWFGFSMVLTGSLKDRRSEFVEFLAKSEVESRPIVAGNFTRNPVLKHLNHVEFEDFPNADLIHDSGLFIGNHHFNLDKQIQAFVAALREFVG